MKASPSILRSLNSIFAIAIYSILVSNAYSIEDGIHRPGNIHSAPPAGQYERRIYATISYMDDLSRLAEIVQETDGTISIRDKKTGNLISQVDGHRSKDRGARTILEDNNTLKLQFADNTEYVFNRSTLELIENYKGSQHRFERKVLGEMTTLTVPRERAEIVLEGFRISVVGKIIDGYGKKVDHIFSNIDGYSEKKDGPVEIGIDERNKENFYIRTRDKEYVFSRTSWHKLSEKERHPPHQSANEVTQTNPPTESGQPSHHQDHESSSHPFERKVLATVTPLGVSAKKAEIVLETNGTISVRANVIDGYGRSFNNIFGFVDGYRYRDRGPAKIVIDGEKIRIQFPEEYVEDVFNLKTLQHMYNRTIGFEHPAHNSTIHTVASPYRIEDRHGDLENFFEAHHPEGSSESWHRNLKAFFEAHNPEGSSEDWHGNLEYFFKANGRRLAKKADPTASLAKELSDQHNGHPVLARLSKPENAVVQLEDGTIAILHTKEDGGKNRILNALPAKPGEPVIVTEERNIVTVKFPYSKVDGKIETYRFSKPKFEFQSIGSVTDQRRWSQSIHISTESGRCVPEALRLAFSKVGK
jgi:hypothetical protein